MYQCTQCRSSLAGEAEWGWYLLLSRGLGTCGPRRESSEALAWPVGEAERSVGHLLLAQASQGAGGSEEGFGGQGVSLAPGVLVPCLPHRSAR